MLNIKVIINLNQVKEYDIILYYFYRQPRHGINPATWMCLHHAMTWISNFIYRSYVSPSNEGRHIALVWFVLPLPLLPLLLFPLLPLLLLPLLLLPLLPLLLLPLLLSEACPDHNLFIFPDRSIVFRMWVHDHNACVAYRNDLRVTLTFDLKVK